MSTLVRLKELLTNACHGPNNDFYGTTLGPQGGPLDEESHSLRPASEDCTQQFHPFHRLIAAKTAAVVKLSTTGYRRPHSRFDPRRPPHIFHQLRIIVHGCMTPAYRTGKLLGSGDRTLQHIPRQRRQQLSADVLRLIVRNVHVSEISGSG